MSFCIRQVSTPPSAVPIARAVGTVDEAPSATTWAILGGALLLGAVFFWSSLGAKQKYRGETFKYNGAKSKKRLPTDDVDRLITRVANRIAWGDSKEEIRSMLLKEGCTESQAYLIYTAAKQLLK